MKENYHHKNLKTELMETAITTISEKGFEGISLRKLAEFCGVSHNAIYRHFKSKDDLIDNCRIYVTQLLTDFLKESVSNCDHSSFSTLKKVGYAYVEFYIEHPTFYSSLYRNAPTKIIFTLNEIEGNYAPFNFVRSIYCECAVAACVPITQQISQFVDFWSLIHGLIPAVISKNTVFTYDYKECIDYYFKGINYETDNING